MIGWFRFGRAQIAIYALAAFALIALVAWRAEALYVERARLIETARARAATLALGTANYIDRTIDVAELMSEDTREYVENHGGLAAIPRDQLQKYLADKVAQTVLHDFLLVVDASGEPIAMSESSRVPKANLSDRQWFRALKGGKRAYIGQAVRSRLGRSIIYMYAKRIDDGHGRMLGAADVAIQTSSVEDPARRRPGQVLTQVWTADGRLIIANFMSFDARGNAIAPPPLFAHAPLKGGGFLKTGDRDLVVAYERANDRAMIATVGFSRLELLASWRQHVWASVVLLTIAALALGGLVWFAMSFLARDARVRKDLEEAAGALSLAVAQRDTLLKEIHHRVKNSLQVTSSLIEMQARQFDDEAVRAAFKRTQQRLYAIGMVHDVLYGEQGVSIVDMRDYLTRLCNEVALANGTRERKIDMTLDISPILLPAEQATSLGLCASEVLVNAFKHAFPQTGGGEISVGLREAGERCELVIRDNGLGIAPVEAGRSLGMRLIRAFAAQLGGEFAFESDGGTTFRLNFGCSPQDEIAAL